MRASAFFVVIKKNKNIAVRFRTVGGFLVRIRTLGFARPDDSRTRRTRRRRARAETKSSAAWHIGESRALRKRWRRRTPIHRAPPREPGGIRASRMVSIPDARPIREAAALH